MKRVKAEVEQTQKDARRGEVQVPARGGAQNGGTKKTVQQR